MQGRFTTKNITAIIGATTIVTTIAGLSLSANAI